MSFEYRPVLPDGTPENQGHDSLTLHRTAGALSRGSTPAGKLSKPELHRTMRETCIQSTLLCPILSSKSDHQTTTNSSIAARTTGKPGRSPAIAESQFLRARTSRCGWSLLPTPPRGKPNCRPDENHALWVKMVDYIQKP